MGFKQVEGGAIALTDRLAIALLKEKEVKDGLTISDLNI